MPGQLSGNILVTCGAGFIARAIYARAREEGWQAQFTCVSRDDAKHVGLRERFPEVACYPFDVGRDADDTLTALMRGHDLVIHAAAMKHVDLAEFTPEHVVRTNIDGSAQVARCAHRAGVGSVIAISTDKACEPVNIYGMTKAVMERIFVEWDQRADQTAYRVVRYGNVIGSSGSVIPRFEQMLASTGVLQLTDPTMTRFWMSANEAIDTIVAAENWMASGVVTVPKPRALSLHDLALVVLGADQHEPELPPGKVEIIGRRPGEKRHEKLIVRAESVRTIDAGDFYTILPPGSASGTDDFEVVSNDPPNGQLGVSEMRDFIQQARSI